MSKLVDKLEKLGYKYKKFFNMWEKEIFNHTIQIMLSEEQILLNEVVNPQNIIVMTQQQIDNLQLAFNELQKDLEVLKDYESN